MNDILTTYDRPVHRGRVQQHYYFRNASPDVLLVYSLMIDSNSTVHMAAVVAPRVWCLVNHGGPLHKINKVDLHVGLLDYELRSVTKYDRITKYESRLTTERFSFQSDGPSTGLLLS